jgi:hypothetical protein
MMDRSVSLDIGYLFNFRATRAFSRAEAGESGWTIEPYGFAVV